MQFYPACLIEAIGIYVGVYTHVYMCLRVLKCVCSTLQWCSVLIIISASILYSHIPSTRTRAHTHTHTHIQHVVYPWFHLSQYYGTEGEQVVVRLLAPILARPRIPAFNGSIEVDVTAEDLPDNNHRYTAKFGKCYLTTVK